MTHRPLLTLSVSFGFLVALVIALHYAIRQDTGTTSHKQVTIAIGTPVPDISVMWLSMAKTLGYWRDEGLDVDIVGSSGSSQVVQQMISGRAAFGELNANLLMQSALDDKIPLRGIMGNGVIDWGLAVKAGGSIAGVRDLKGKSIGIASLAIGGKALLEGYLRENGLDPARDVHIVAVGVGAPALKALQGDRVHALMFWQTALTGFENAGAKLTIMRSPSWEKLPDFTLTTLDSTLRSSPDMAEGVVRGIAKALVFIRANPECARKIFVREFPEMRSQGANDAEIKRKDLAIIGAQLETLDSAHTLNGGKLIGDLNPTPYRAMQDFLVSAGSLRNRGAPEHFLQTDRDFFSKVNAFDRAAIVASAKTCRHAATAASGG